MSRSTRHQGRSNQAPGRPTAISFDPRTAVPALSDPDSVIGVRVLGKVCAIDDPASRGARANALPAFGERPGAKGPNFEGLGRGRNPLGPS